MSLHTRDERNGGGRGGGFGGRVASGQLLCSCVQLYSARPRSRLTEPRVQWMYPDVQKVIDEHLSRTLGPAATPNKASDTIRTQTITCDYFDRWASSTMATCGVGSGDGGGAGFRQSINQQWESAMWACLYIAHKRWTRTWPFQCLVRSKFTNAIAVDARFRAGDSDLCESTIPGLIAVIGGIIVEVTLVGVSSAMTLRDWTLAVVAQTTKSTALPIGPVRIGWIWYELGIYNNDMQFYSLSLCPDSINPLELGERVVSRVNVDTI